MGDIKLKINDHKTEVTAIGTRSSLSLPLCPFQVVTYHSLSLLETMVSTEMKHSPWMYIVLYLCGNLFCQLRRIRIDEQILTDQQTAPKTLHLLTCSAD